MIHSWTFNQNSAQYRDSPFDRKLTTLNRWKDTFEDQDARRDRRMLNYTSLFKVEAQQKLTDEELRYCKKKKKKLSEIRRNRKMEKEDKRPNRYLQSTIVHTM